jgi:hypothetical protein
MNGLRKELEVDEVDDPSWAETGFGLGVAERMVEAIGWGASVIVRR